MSFTNDFPYTDFHEINLDWILNKIKEFQNRIDSFEDTVLKKFQEKVSTSFWAKTDDTHTLIRLATSWATTEEEVDELIAWMNECK